MRRSMFGDYIAESQEDDLGEAFIAKKLDPDQCYALITDDGEEGITVEFFGSEDGEEVLSTDPDYLAFDNVAAAKKYALNWVYDVQMH